MDRNVPGKAARGGNSSLTCSFSASVSGGGGLFHDLRILSPDDSEEESELLPSSESLSLVRRCLGRLLPSECFVDRLFRFPELEESAVVDKEEDDPTLLSSPSPSREVWRETLRSGVAFIPTEEEGELASGQMASTNSSSGSREEHSLVTCGSVK